MSTRIPSQQSVMRKAPRQARSRATVESVIQAGTHILGAEGWAGFNTNRIAELAGVSIGSLYQYFPDKRALVDAIRQRHLDDCISAVREASSTSSSLEEFAVNLVEKMIAAHGKAPNLHRALLDEAPISAQHRDPDSQFEVEYLFSYAQAIALHQGREPMPQDHLTARIISDALDGVIHNAARRGEINDKAIAGELARLTKYYLEHPK